MAPKKEALDDHLLIVSQSENHPDGYDVWHIPDEGWKTEQYRVKDKSLRKAVVKRFVKNHAVVGLSAPKDINWIATCTFIDLRLLVGELPPSRARKASSGKGAKKKKK